MTIVIVAAGASASAQDEDELDGEEGAGDRVARRVLFTEKQLDLQIFGRVETVESARARLNNVLSQQLRTLDRQYLLTDAQRDKLLLAGRGDIKRAIDRVEELKRKLELVKYERRGVIQCLEEAGRMRSELQSGIFGVNSLLAKTIATTITQEQKDNEDDLLREYVARRYPRSVVEVADRLVRVLNLSPEQHQRLKKLLMVKIRPPRRLGDSVYAYIMYQLSKLPEAEVRPIFSDSQWKLLHQFLVGWSGARPFLEHDGFVFDDSPATRLRSER